MSSLLKCFEKYPFKLSVPRMPETVFLKDCFLLASIAARGW
jgi:hypothetical protein